MTSTKLSSILFHSFFFPPKLPTHVRTFSELRTLSMTLTHPCKTLLCNLQPCHGKGTAGVCRDLSPGAGNLKGLSCRNRT